MNSPGSASTAVAPPALEPAGLGLLPPQDLKDTAASGTHDEPTSTQEEAQKIVRPSTGVLERATRQGGKGQLHINNGTTDDAFAVLTSSKGTPVASAYIRARESVSMRSIREGDYFLYFSTGKRWDEAQGQFSKPVSYQRFEKPMSFTTTLRGYTVWKVTLHQVVGGNARTTGVDPDEFPSL